MDTNVFIEVSAASPPASSAPAKQSKQVSDGASLFGQLLTKEINRNQTSNHTARSGRNQSSQSFSTEGRNGKSVEELSTTTPNSNTSNEAPEVKSSDPQTPQPAADNSAQNGAVLTVIASTAQPVPVPTIQPEAENIVAEETSGKILMEITLQMLTGGEQAEEPPPEIAQGQAVPVEQPPPQTTSPEPARLAEAQPETKLTSDKTAPQTINNEEFQRLLMVKQVGEETPQTSKLNGQNTLTTSQAEHQVNIAPQSEPKVDIAPQSEHKVDIAPLSEHQVNVTPQTGQKVNINLPNEDYVNVNSQSGKDVQNPLQGEQKAPDSEVQNEVQTGSEQHIQAQQAAKTLDQATPQVHHFFRSLQQYSQIKEISYSQTAETEIDLQVTAGEETALTAAETSQSDMPTPITSEVTPKISSTSKTDASAQQQAIESARVEKPQPEKDDAQVEKPVIDKQMPEMQIESSDTGEAESSNEMNVEPRPKITQKSDGQEIHTKMQGVEKPDAQPKDNTLKADAPKAGPVADGDTVKKGVTAETTPSQADNQATADGEASSINTAKTADNTTAAAIFDIKANEVAQKFNESPTVQRVVQQTFNQLEGMLQSGQKTLRVQLYPESLGHLELRVTSQNGSLQVVILADSSVTQQALQQHARDLQHTLLQSGVNLTGLTVGQRGNQDQAFPESHQTHQQKLKANGRTMSEEDVEQIDAEATNRLSYLNPYTSMEFRV